MATTSYKELRWLYIGFFDCTQADFKNLVMAQVFKLHAVVVHEITQ